MNLKFMLNAVSNETLEKNNARIIDRIGTEIRKRMVCPLFISLDSYLFYATNDKNVEPIFSTTDSAMNWTDFWAVDKGTGLFIHQRQVREWLIFMFGRDDAVEDLFRKRGYPDELIDRILDWRNTLIHYGGKRGGKKHRVGIFYIGDKAAHKAAAAILSDSRWFDIKTLIINGDNTTNRECKRLIVKNLDGWKDKNSQNPEKKFIILAAGMGNRSLSVGKITFAVYTGDNPSDASFDQKTARVRTELGDNKEAFIIDCSLTKDYSFHAESLVRQYAKQNSEKRLEKVVDRFWQCDTFFKYVCTCLDNGRDDYLQVMRDTDYLEICRARSDAQIGEFIWDDIGDAFDGLPLNSAITKFTGKIEIPGTKNPKGNGHDLSNEDDGNGNGNGDDKPDEKNTTGSKKVSPYKKLIVEMVNDLLKKFFFMSYATVGEDKKHPIAARWAENREKWISTHAEKYGGKEDCATYWDMFIDKVKDNAYLNARLAGYSDDHAKEDFDFED